jgi:uncharacterized protein (TIGR02646 family)
MKHIQKNTEPVSLKAYRETTPNATYSGFGSKDQLKDSLLAEQGHLCAYCMQRISRKWNNALSKDRIEVEHYLPQEIFPDKQLDYRNLLGVCNGVSGGEYHCDKTKGGKGDGTKRLIKLKPLHKSIENLVSYALGGKLISLSQDSAVTDELEKMLNLNNQNLVDMRRNALDKAWEDFKKRHSTKVTWSKALFQEEIAQYSKKGRSGKYKEFCQFIIWFFTKQANSSKYP